MIIRRSDYDVTNRVNTSESGAVKREVAGIYASLYDGGQAPAMEQAFDLVGRIYAGRHPGYLACDTWYHDLHHVLDVTLAMSRLLDGYERSRGSGDRLGAELFQLGVLVALFHDVGYIRRTKDTRHHYGAEYTRKHVSRSAAFLKRHLPDFGLAAHADAASKIVHFTGYEMPVDRIPLPEGPYRTLGNLVGSADIMAQMADRCYLEKCRDRLYPEFVLGGLARRRGQSKNGYLFESSTDLILKTPGFYESAHKRLAETLHGVYRKAERHFGGQNLYWEEVEKNIRFATQVAKEGDVGMLKRQPPETPVMASVPVPDDAL